MKKAIWILFIFAALIWTAFAFAASGLARWTSEAIATAPKSNSSWTSTAETVTTAVTAPINEAVGAATAGIGKLGATVPALPALPPMPAMPPVPEWINQWLTPARTQSLREWGAWAKAAAGFPQTANIPNTAGAPNSATTTAPAAATSENLNNTAVAATQSATQAAAVKATQLAEQARATAIAASPWLASMVGWLVPTVWVLWGLGLLVGLVLTLVLQWLVGRLSSGESGGGSDTPARSFS